MKVVIGFFIGLLPIVALAQDSKTFTRDKEFYIEGNTKVIGNNILSKDATKSFNDLEKVNDEFKMEYVDIDNDPSTYSSSAAFLTLDDAAKVVYAGLYWTGTYKGEKSVKKYKNERTFYQKKEDRAHDMQEIKIQFPGLEYQDIRGELIFDGASSKNLRMKNYSPYACKADITSYFDTLEVRSGMYTVANISATQGYLLGGSSAGWLLYVVYEKENDPLQYITTYHGFEFVNKKPVEIEFGNFRSSDDGEVGTMVTMGALEGDVALSRDQVGIYNPKDSTYVKLDNKVRASDNFFNSTITLNDTIFRQRIPNSENTLGFDIAKIKIPNEQNAIIANNATGVKMQYKTRSDRFFLFFTAFQTTISEEFYKMQSIKTNSPIVAVAAVPVLSMPTDTIPAPTEEEVASIDVVDDVTETIVEETPNPKVITETPKMHQELDRILNRGSVAVPDFEKGYYVVTNVFSNAENAANWSTTLRSMEYEPQTMQRPDTNLFYVFVAHGQDGVALYETLKNVRSKEFLKSAWMLKINMD
jgi:hypothetical protein